MASRAGQPGRPPSRCGALFREPVRRRLGDLRRPRVPRTEFFHPRSRGDRLSWCRRRRCLERAFRYSHVAMIVLSGADLVLTGGIQSPATLIIDGDRISDVVPGTKSAGTTAQRSDLSGYFIVPGFIDVHVHGVEGTDV